MYDSLIKKECETPNNIYESRIEVTQLVNIPWAFKQSVLLSIYSMSQRASYYGYESFKSICHCWLSHASLT